MPAHVYVDFLIAVASGHDAKIIDDHGELKIGWPEHGLVPTLEQRLAAMHKLVAYGFGMPVQQHVLEQDVSVRISALGASLNMNELTPGQMRALAQAHREILQLQATALPDQTPAPLEASQATSKAIVELVDNNAGLNALDAEVVEDSEE